MIIGVLVVRGFLVEPSISVIIKKYDWTILLRKLKERDGS